MEVDMSQPVATFTPEEEAALQARDERVIAALEALYERHAIAKEEADAAWRELNRFVRAVKDDRWFDLSGHLSAADVESLCNVSPSPESILQSGR
jgi:hypothetical protein